MGFYPVADFFITAAPACLMPCRKKYFLRVLPFAAKPVPYGHGLLYLFFTHVLIKAVFAATSAAWTGKIVTVSATSCCGNCLFFF